MIFQEKLQQLKSCSGAIVKYYLHYLTFNWVNIIKVVIYTKTNEINTQVHLLKHMYQFVTDQ